MARRTGPVALGMVAALLLAACSGGDPDDAEVPPDPSAEPTTVEPTTSATPEPAELGELYPVPGGLVREFPEPVGTLSDDEGDEVSIYAVHRLAEDRVVVTGSLVVRDRPNDELPMEHFSEPGYRTGMAGGIELAALELTVSGDETTYLPVRDEQDRCLCSVVRAGFQEGSPRVPVMVVMTAPADAGTVTVGIEAFGTVADVPVTELPEEHLTPWGLGQTLSVGEVRRDDGVITARVSVASIDEAPQLGMGVHQFTTEQLCFAGLAAVGGAVGTHSTTDCFWGMTPPTGQAVDVEASFPDPGTDEVVLLPWNGFPLVVPVEGAAAEGAVGDPEQDHVRSYGTRTATAGATVSSAEEVTVSLDAAVMFEDNESTLTSGAQDTLAVALDVLRGQDGRTLVVDGHTDTQGSAAHNLELSLARAEAVRDALAEELPGGWRFTVNGYGFERTVAEERGTPREVEEARARNRRVEITIEP